MVFRTPNLWNIPTNTSTGCRSFWFRMTFPYRSSACGLCVAATMITSWAWSIHHRGLSGVWLGKVHSFGWIHLDWSLPGPEWVKRLGLQKFPIGPRSRWCNFYRFERCTDSFHQFIRAFSTPTSLPTSSSYCSFTRRISGTIASSIFLVFSSHPLWASEKPCVGERDSLQTRTSSRASSIQTSCRSWSSWLPFLPKHTCWSLRWCRYASGRHLAQVYWTAVECPKSLTLLRFKGCSRGELFQSFLRCQAWEGLQKLLLLPRKHPLMESAKHAEAGGLIGSSIHQTSTFIACRDTERIWKKRDQIGSY